MDFCNIFVYFNWLSFIFYVMFRNCFCPKRFFCFNNGLAEDFRTISLDDLHIQNDNCCFCYYDAVVKQLPEPFLDSTDDLNEILFDNGKKKQHIKMIFANFSSKVNKRFKFYLFLKVLGNFFPFLRLENRLILLPWIIYKKK